jgi:hypothetical protein
VRLLLSTYGSDGTPRYSIDSTNCATATGVNVIDAYFIRSSVLTLYTHLSCSDANVIDSRYVLSYDNSFVYNQNAWRPSIVGGQTIGGLDIGTVVDEFLKAPPNLNINVPHGIDQQRWLVTNMMSYMDAYVAWAGTSFQSPQLKSGAIARQQDMMDTVFGLFEKIGGKDCTPVNTTACTNSP